MRYVAAALLLAILLAGVYYRSTKIVMTVCAVAAIAALIMRKYKTPTV
jgi:hypothetical protein